MHQVITNKNFPFRSLTSFEMFFDEMKYFSYDGQKYTDHPKTVHDHYITSLGDLENKILAVGSHSTMNTKVELFDIDSNTWTTKSSFPYCSSQ